MKTLSILIPAHNEEEGIKHFITEELLPELKKVNSYNIEIVIVNDGSTDNTLTILHQLAAKDPRIKVISLSRNFGKEAALAAGLCFVSGAGVIMMDADGQQPPHLIPQFIAKWEQGAEVVTGVRDKYTKHGFIQKLGSKFFYKLLNLMGSRSTVPGSTDFRLLDRVVIDEYNKLTEHNRITRGLIDWLGFDTVYIEYVYGERFAGRPSYSLKKLFNLAIDSFVSLSTTPLVIFGYLGVFITFFSFLLGLFIIINQYILGDPLHLYWNGAVQMSVFITFLVGLVLISQAITALYISHIHTETKNRPLFIIDYKKSCNLPKKSQL